MALFDFPRRAPHGIASLMGRVIDWNDIRQSRNALSRLSAHELDDIGLAPGDIDRLTTRIWR